MIKVILISLLAFILGGIAMWHVIVNVQYQKEKPVIKKAQIGNRDIQRKVDINAYLSLLKDYLKEQGKLPDEITETPKEIRTGEADICYIFITKYIVTMPHDPSIEKVGGFDDCNEFYETGYTISKNGNIVTISAPHAEGEQITITQDLSN